MSQKSVKLLDALGGIPDRYLEESREDRPRRRFRAWGAVAACLVAVIALGVAVRGGWLPFAGGGGAGGHGSGEGFQAFNRYAGPVFPLTLEEENIAISARREVTLDCQSWEQSQAVQVTDRYTLRNDSQDPQTLEVLYPFAGTLAQAGQWPDLTLDGTPLESGLRKGEIPGTTSSLDSLLSGEAYQAMLEDPEYRILSLDTMPEAEHVPVTVYELTDLWGPEQEDGSVADPVLQVTVRYDPAVTEVWCFGFDQARTDPESGCQVLCISLNRAKQNPETGAYLLVKGEDVRSMDLQGRTETGEDGEQVEAGAEVNRREADLDEALNEIAEVYRQETYGDALSTPEEKALFYGRFLARWEESGETALEDALSDNAAMMLYRTAEITVPPESSVTLTATLEKDWSGSRTMTDTVGYEVATRMGSNLQWEQQQAVLEDRGQITIAQENFGFDLKKGIRTVPMEEELLRLDVRG